MCGSLQNQKRKYCEIQDRSIKSICVKPPKETINEKDEGKFMKGTLLFLQSH